ncbi:MAG: hypothetical protein VW547_11090 [Alphaproteobacteria bacterium]
MTSPATYRCTACGQEFSATSAYVRHGLSHLIDPTGRSPRVCFRGRMEPVAPVVIDTARDDRAGVTLPTAIQPVGGDQLEATPRLRRSVERRLIDLEAAVREELGQAGARVVEMERSKP